jgi:hypothetical protein
MDDPKNKFAMYTEIAAGSLIIVAVAMHGAVQGPVCLGQQYVCPEPEQRLADMPEHNYPRAPSQLYGGQVMAITTSTNNLLGSFISTGPQYPPNVQSSVYRSV